MSRPKDKEKTRRPVKGPGMIGRAVRGLVFLIWRVMWRLAVIVAMIVGGATFYFYSDLPPSEKLFDGRGVGALTLRDRRGEIFAWRGEQYGGDLRANEVSPHLVNAVIAAEDKRYYSHIGLDPRGILRAMVANYRAGRLVQGGSTLTQQVAKNVFLDARRRLERKIKEVPMALALELKYSKEEILSVYLNRVYLGAGTYGFEAAAQRYFGKSARVLSPAEAAMLAGLLRAPSRLAPTRDLERSQGRASVIVRLMEQQGYLTGDQTIQALANPAVLSQAAAARAGGAFADWVMDEGGEDQFLKLFPDSDFDIQTTFDPGVQRMAEAALAEVFRTKVRAGSKAQAAIVVMTHDGAVRAMVGGREKGAAQFNRATQALRQTGSAFKPVVYAAGLESGMRPNDIMQDTPVNIGGWSPKNYGGGYRGPVTLTEALAQSVNTVAVRISERAGRGRVSDLAQGMGISTPLASGPSIALGTSEARLIEMTGAFATIANGGQSVRPYGVSAIRVRGDASPIHARKDGRGDRVISPETAGLLTYMMERVVQDGTGKRAQLDGWEAAGKTGTTQRARDAWFIGYTADYVTGVWMGYDDNRPLTGVTGGGLPADIWREVMARLHDGRTPKPLNKIKPAVPQIVLAPTPERPTPIQPAPQPNRQQPARNVDPAPAPSPATRQPTVVEQIFRDVVQGLGNSGPSQPDTPQERMPAPGNDR